MTEEILWVTSFLKHQSEIFCYDPLGYRRVDTIFHFPLIFPSSTKKSANNCSCPKNSMIMCTCPTICTCVGQMHYKRRENKLVCKLLIVCTHTQKPKQLESDQDGIVARQKVARVRPAFTHCSRTTHIVESPDTEYFRTDGRLSKGNRFEFKIKKMN